MITPPPAAQPSPRRLLLTWLALGVVLLLPRAFHGDAAPWLAIGLHGEWCVAVALAAWWGRGARLLAGLWVALLCWELARLVGVLLTAEDPLLYDLIQLARHVGLLLLDLGGRAALLGVAAAATVLGALGVGVAWILPPVVSAPSTPRRAGVLAVYAAALSLIPGPAAARFALPGLLVNAQKSWDVYRVAATAVSADPYAALAGIAPTRRPHVELLVVESYGQVVDTTKTLRGVWLARLEHIAAQKTIQGWHIASGVLEAPVSGGRSWLSDASALSGLSVAHQSVYSQVQPHLPELTHLPGWLAAAGYHTVVSRPKDRARRGVPLRNDFGWQHTLFAEEVGYSGAPIGWGAVPDQYTLGRLYDDLLPSLEDGPRLVFHHGVSAHGPWEAVPPLVEDWRSLDDLAIDGVPAVDVASLQMELTVQAQRFSRKTGRHQRLPARRFPELRARYWAALDYSLQVAFAAVGPPGDHPDGRLVIIYGDHQPPLLARSDDYGVPVHVLASDPALLEPLLARGFTPGLHSSGDAVAPLSALFALTAEVLLHAGGQALPSVPEGVDVTAAQATP